MKTSKKLPLIMIISMLVLSSIPSGVQALKIYGYYGFAFTEGNDQEYVLVYKKDVVETDIVQNREIYSRRVYKTPTEFRTEYEEDDVKISQLEFEIEDHNYFIMNSSLVKHNEVVYLMVAARDLTTNKLAIFATYTEDNGNSWQKFSTETETGTLDYTCILTSDISYTSFYCFDSVVFQGNITFVYTFRDGIRVNSTIVSFDPTNLEAKMADEQLDEDEYTSKDAEYMGLDFDLYEHEGRIYVVYSDVRRKHIKFTYLKEDGVNLAEATIIEPPVGDTNILNPSIVFWNEGFYIIGQDKHSTIVEQAMLFEIHRWGVWIEEVGSDSPIVISKIGKALHDGFYEQKSLLSTYKDNLIAVYERGDSSLGGGLPDIGFFFSDDGEQWTTKYLGEMSLFTNLGFIFFVATIGVFIVVLPSYIFIKKSKK